MLNITSNLPMTSFARPTYRVEPAASSAKSVNRAGTVVYLSQAALDLHQQLEAVDAEKKRNQQARQQAPDEAEPEASAEVEEALADAGPG